MHEEIIYHFHDRDDHGHAFERWNSGIPGNGFLLGIVRHGGFLPNEGIDANIGIMYEDLSGKALNFVVQGVTHTYTVTKKPPGKWATFNGTDPWSKQTYDVESVTIQRTDGTSFQTYCF